MRMQLRAGLMAACVLLVTSPASAQVRPWLNPSLAPDERADLVPNR